MSPVGWLGMALAISFVICMLGCLVWLAVDILKGFDDED